MMRMAILATLLLGVAVPASAQTARFDWFDYRDSDPVDTTIKQGPGDYRNPILGGFYPDPSVTRVGEDFYLVTSTFSYFPGIPVFHSRDLVNWTQIANAIDRPGQLDFKQLGLSRGVFAPTIQHKDGLFYILNTCVDCGGNFVITAKNPAGPWSDPVFLPDLKGGIDPSLFFDEDGRTWIINNDAPAGPPQYQGHRALWVQEFDLKGLKTFGPRTMIVDGGVDIRTKPIWIEGPHIFRKDGWYYLSAAEGGTAEGHSQVILRSKSVLGPWTPGPGNPILTQRDLPRDRAHPITSAGHAQLVTTPDGKWWATFLAVRPYEGDYYNTGRETFLLPVEWKDGWPVILERGKPIPYVHPKPALPAGQGTRMSGPLAVREEFAGPKLPAYWMMMRNPKSDWYRFDKGALVLTARPDGLGDNANPSFLGRRQQNMNAVATTVVRFTPGKNGDRAGLAALQSDEYWGFVGIGMEGGKPVVLVENRAGASDPKPGRILASAPLTAKPGAPVWLRVTASGKDYVFAYATTQGRWQTLGTLDAKQFSTKSAGGFVGTVFGPYARSGQ
jgi:xylan 1,4-beta-xylosidase